MTNATENKRTEYTWRDLLEMGYKRGLWNIHANKKGTKAMKPIDMVVYGLLIICFMGIIGHITGFTQKLAPEYSGLEYIADGG